MTENTNAIGDILVKIRGRHYLIPAEAIGAPLEAGDGGSALVSMLEKEIGSIPAADRGIELAIELGAGDDRDARAISARQARQCTRQARQCTRQARQCTRTARQLSAPSAQPAA